MSADQDPQSPKPYPVAVVRLLVLRGIKIERWLTKNIVHLPVFLMIILVTAGFSWIVDKNLTPERYEAWKRVQVETEATLQMLRPSDLWALAFDGYSDESLSIDLPAVEGGSSSRSLTPPTTVHEATYEKCIANQNSIRSKDFCTADVENDLKELVGSEDEMLGVDRNQPIPGHDQAALYSQCLHNRHSTEFAQCKARLLSSSQTQFSIPKDECPPGIRCAAFMLPGLGEAAETRCFSEIASDDAFCVPVSSQINFDGWCDRAIKNFCIGQAAKIAAEKKVSSFLPITALATAFFWEGGHLKWLQISVLLVQLGLGAALASLVVRLRSKAGPIDYIVWGIFYFPALTLFFGSLTAIPVVLVVKASVRLFGYVMGAAMTYAMPTTFSGCLLLTGAEHKIANGAERLFTFLTRTILARR